MTKYFIYWYAKPTFMNNKTKELELEFYEIVKTFHSDYLSFYDRSNSLISEKNNHSFHKEKERSLKKALIEKSNDFSEITNSQKDYLISASLSKFRLLINPTSKS